MRSKTRHSSVTVPNVQSQRVSVSEFKTSLVDEQK